MIGGIPDDKWQKIVSVIKKHRNVSGIVLYGSRAKGTFKKGSDIDLALKGKNISSEQLTQINLDYEDLYLPWKLGITVYSDISNRDLKDHIDRVGIDISTKKSPSAAT